MSANPGGRPRGVSEFRERCRERTTEVIEILESVFFTGHWPNRQKFVSDAVRMQAGVMLIANGWGTPPSSHDIKIKLPQTDAIKQITPEMTTQEAMEAYARTVANTDMPRLEPLVTSRRRSKASAST